MKYALLIMLCCSLAYPTEENISGVLTNSRPEIHGVSVYPSAQIFTPPKVIVRINGTITDLNGFSDLLENASSCVWRMSKHNDTTPILFYNCGNISCDFSTEKAFDPGIDPHGAYTATITVSDHTGSSAAKVTILHDSVSQPSGREIKERMRLEETFECPGDLLKAAVMDEESRPIDDVRGYLFRGQNMVGEGYSDENGMAYFSIPANDTYVLIFHKDGYLSVEESVYLSVCPRPNPVVPECLDDSDCSDNKRCSSGKCLAVTGECGHAEGHSWVGYECCSDTECGPASRCVDNACGKSSYELAAAPTAGTGTETNISAKRDSGPFSNATIYVTSPDNRRYTLISDENGTAVLRLDLPGTYTLSLIVGGVEVKRAAIQAIAPGPSVPRPGEGNQVPSAEEGKPGFVETARPLIFIALLIAAIVVYLIWKRRKKR